MGNYKFKLSDMIPNSWFYKLKDMRRSTTTTTSKNPTRRHLNNPKPPAPATRTTQQSNSNSSSTPFPQPNQLYIPNRPSYYISSTRPQSEHPSTSPAHPKASDTHFPLGPPRKSKKRLHHRSSSSKKQPLKPSDSNCSSSSVSACNDITIDDMKSLPPIHTKPVQKKEAAELDGKQHIMLRRAQQGLHRIRVRPSSPKIDIKRSQQRVGSSRRLGESYAIVKRSADPRRDFKESMVDMIVENDIRRPRDLEELLACYLSLNSDEYHDLIVKVFEEIWVDLTDLRDCL